MHKKRQNAPKSWPIKKKGSTFLVKANFNSTKGIPILILLRDLLKITKNRKEVKKAISKELILLNNKKITDEKNVACLFDVLTIVPSKEHYQITLSEKGKFVAKKIDEKDSHFKIAKIKNKRVLKGKKIQLNLEDGKNFISELKCLVNDSVLIDFKNKKIAKCFPLKENREAFVFAGKHSGTQGKIKKIDLKSKMVELESEKNKVNVLIKQLMVIE
jgi:small subunit ribosomal protein S4e